MSTSIIPTPPPTTTNGTSTSMSTSEISDSSKPTVVPVPPAPVSLKPVLPTPVVPLPVQPAPVIPQQPFQPAPFVPQQPFQPSPVYNHINTTDDFGPSIAEDFGLPKCDPRDAAIDINANITQIQNQQQQRSFSQRLSESTGITINVSNVFTNVWNSVKQYIKQKLTEHSNTSEGYRNADLGTESEFYYCNESKMWKKRGETIEQMNQRAEELKKKGTNQGMHSSPGLVDSVSGLGAAPAPPPPMDTRTEEQKRRAREALAARGEFTYTDWTTGEQIEVGNGKLAKSLDEINKERGLRLGQVGRGVGGGQYGVNTVTNSTNDNMTSISTMSTTAPSSTSSTGNYGPPVPTNPNNSFSKPKAKANFNIQPKKSAVSKADSVSAQTNPFAHVQSNPFG